MSAPASPPPRRSRFGRRLATRLALVVAGVALAALLAEFGVRLLLGVQPKFPRHVVRAPWGIRYNDPGAEYGHHSADVDIRFRINRNGMRADRDFAYEKPPGLRRIVSLGDSFTIGYEVALEDCFSSVLEQRLRAAGCNVEVLNCGVSGFGTAEECIYLERELLRYHPDLVLVSFFQNDLDDNVRSGLFRLDEHDRLVEAAHDYVPAGGFGDFVNRSWLLNWLSEHSDAFTAAKEALTNLVKRKKVEANEQKLGVAGGGAEASPANDPERGERLLCARLLDRIYDTCRSRSIPLVIQSIPDQQIVKEELVECFPSAEFDVKRPGLEFLPMFPLLKPLEGKELLYHRRSHHHWTPLAHRLSGEALAKLILEKGLLPK